MSTTRLFLQPLALAVALAFAARAVVRVYAIPSASMEPTLQAGDHILATTCDHAARGDVIVFRSPRDGDQLLVKRVVGVPGDVVNAQTVPKDAYYVMGDNRANSVDSRAWGAVPRTAVVGRARMVLWSSGMVRLFKPVH